MKNYLIAFACMLTMGILPMNAQKINDETDSLVAYSDTTGVEDSADSAYITINQGGKYIRIAVPSDQIDDEDFNAITDSINVDIDTMTKIIHDTFGLKEGAAIGAFGLIFILVFCVFLLLIILPIIIVAYILRRIVKNHNRSVEQQQFYNDTASRAYDTPPSQEQYTDNMSSRQQASQNIYPEDPERTTRQRWEQGVRNTSIGVGIAILFKIMGLDSLVGIGILIAILGIGQMVISKTSK